MYVFEHPTPAPFPEGERNKKYSSCTLGDGLLISRRDQGVRSEPISTL
jgi:hypothetical protein